MPRYLVDEWNPADLRTVLAAKGSVLVGTGLGTPEELVALPVSGTDGAVPTEDSTVTRGLAYARGLIMAVPFQTLINASATDTNSPSSERFFLGSHRSVVSVPLATFRQVSFRVNKQGTAGASGYKVHLKYNTSFSTTVGDYSNLGTSAVEVDADTTNTILDSGWIDLASGAKVDPCYVAITTSGGDSATDPQFGHMVAYFRR